MKKLLVMGCGVLLISAGLISCGGGGGSDSPATGPTGQITLLGSASAPLAAPLSLDGADVSYAFLPPANGCDGCDPVSVMVLVEQLWLSTAADCTGLVKVTDKGAGAAYQEMSTGPTLIDSSVAPGTYPCMALKMSDVIKFTPNATADAFFTACTAGTQYDHDILKAFDSEMWFDPETNSTTLSDGTNAAPVAQDVFVYFTTDMAAALAANASLHQNQTLPLASPVVVLENQSTQGTLYFDFANQVIAETTFCTLDAPDVGFAF